MVMSFPMDQYPNMRPESIEHGQDLGSIQVSEIQSDFEPYFTNPFGQLDILLDQKDPQYSPPQDYTIRTQLSISPSGRSLDVRYE